jgi:cysteine synthase
MARFDNITRAIGGTPLVRLNRLAPPDVNVYVKVESFNPMGSVKDRMALAIIEDAEASGALQPGQTVIEATSGNTGIGLAMVCAQKGYPLVVTMAENFSIERRKMLRFLGAKIVLTPAAAKGSGMLAKAEELARTHGWFLCRQFENRANADVHTRTTAAEIIADMGTDRLDVFVTGFGTGGTLLGTARGLKVHDPAIRVVAAEPDNSQLLGSGIRQQRDASGGVAASHPNFRPHLMQGWSPDFISRLAETAVDEKLIDEIVPVAGNDAMRLSGELATKEGIFAGTSSGATLAAALHIARDAAPGTNIVCMLPDTAERYLSTPLFEHIGADMNAEEMRIAESTPGFRFDVATPPAPAPDKAVAPPPQTDAATVAHVDKLIAGNKVVMFALEWCEFCWSARKLFAKLGIKYLSVDLDSVVMQADNRGAKVRAELANRTGSPTIPQIYIGGVHVGGCTELFDAMRSGDMQKMLEDCGADFARSVAIDPYELLPKWVHPRKTA